jgi:hypothetical protein
MESCAKIARFLQMPLIEIQRLAGYEVDLVRSPDLSREQAAALAQVERLIKEADPRRLPNIMPSVEQLFLAFNFRPEQHGSTEDTPQSSSIGSNHKVPVLAA